MFQLNKYRNLSTSRNSPSLSREAGRVEKVKLKEIKVSKKDISPDFDIEPARGVGYWTTEVKQTREQKLTIGYEVKYPRKYNFVL